MRGLFSHFAYSSEVSKYLTLFDLTARSHHSSPDVDSFSAAASCIKYIFYVKLPSQPLFSTGEFKSGLCMCVCEWFCCISIWTEGAYETLTRCKVSVSDTHTLISVLQTNLNCNYSRGSVLETLEGRAGLWSNASARHVPYSCGNRLLAWAAPDKGRRRPLLTETWN